MAIMARNAGGNYEPVPAGNHVARVYSIIHIGTVRENIKGEEKEMNKVRISFELPNETKEFKEGEGEKPYTISKDYTLSMFEKSDLRKFIDSTVPGGLSEEEVDVYDVTLLMGKAVMLNVIHKTSGKGNVYANITAAAAIPKGMTVPGPVNAPFVLDYENFDEAKFNALPDFLKDKMRSSQEYKALKGSSPEQEWNREAGEVNPDEIPV
jgi:hypothetical protein